jgi:hypothetical protein
MHPLLKYLRGTGNLGPPDELFRPLTYLAGPYSYKHEDPEEVKRVQEERFLAETQAAAWLMNTYDWNVFSPITHSHPLHIHSKMRGDWEFWKRIDTEFLQLCCRIVVLGIDGWRESTGVTAELKIAKEFGIPRYFLTRQLGRTPNMSLWTSWHRRALIPRTASACTSRRCT